MNTVGLGHNDQQQQEKKNNLLRTRYKVHCAPGSAIMPCPMCVSVCVRFSALAPAHDRREARGLGNPPERARGNCLIKRILVTDENTITALSITPGVFSRKPSFT